MTSVLHLLHLEQPFENAIPGSILKMMTMSLTKDKPHGHCPQTFRGLSKVYTWIPPTPSTLAHHTLLVWSFYWFIHSRPRYPEPAVYQVWSERGWMFGGSVSVLELRKFSVALLALMVLYLYRDSFLMMTSWSVSLLTTLKPVSREEEPWSPKLSVS